jgi:ParB-like chromosome segregation protein Spo0J
MTWQNRIVAHGTESPEDLLANPYNWRIHPEHQQKPLDAILRDVGFVQAVIVNRCTGHLVDGHARVMLAMRNNQKQIPVDYVELTEEEELLALATLDPISAMAKSNAHMFAQLLEHANTGEADLMAYLEEFAERIGAVEEDTTTKDKDGSREYGEDDFAGFAHECPDCGFKFS